MMRCGVTAMTLRIRIVKAHSTSTSTSEAAAALCFPMAFCWPSWYISLASTGTPLIHSAAAACVSLPETLVGSPAVTNTSIITPTVTPSRSLRATGSPRRRRWSRPRSQHAERQRRRRALLRQRLPPPAAWPAWHPASSSRRPSPLHPPGGSATKTFNFNSMRCLAPNVLALHAVTLLTAGLNGMRVARQARPACLVGLGWRIQALSQP